MLRLALLICAPLLIAAPAAAQIDPSNPAGAPTSPSQTPLTKPEQGEVIRDAAPLSADGNISNQPRAPSVAAGVEEPQRTETTREPKGEERGSPAANPAPIDQGPPIERKPGRAAQTRW